jgi:hypothetical protein
MLRSVMSCVIVVLAVAVLLQVFTPFPVLTGIGNLAKVMVS